MKIQINYRINHLYLIQNWPLNILWFNKFFVRLTSLILFRHFSVLIFMGHPVYVKNDQKQWVTAEKENGKPNRCPKSTKKSGVHVLLSHLYFCPWDWIGILDNEYISVILYKRLGDIEIKWTIFSVLLHTCNLTFTFIF